jgi:hypothetical protein
MRGRIRKLRLSSFLKIFEDGNWQKKGEVKDSIGRLMPSVARELSDRTIGRYLDISVKMGNLEEKIEPSGIRYYRLSSKGGMTLLSSMVSDSIKIQSDIYPDLQKGSIVLEITRGKELFGLLIALQENIRVKYSEKDAEWRSSSAKNILSFIYALLDEQRPAFAQKIPKTDMFIFKPPPQLLQIMASRIKLGDYETEEGIIIHAMNEWMTKPEKEKVQPISLEHFPFIQDAVKRGLFRSHRDAMMGALTKMETEMRTRTSSLAQS